MISEPKLVFADKKSFILESISINITCITNYKYTS